MPVSSVWRLDSSFKCESVVTWSWSTLVPYFFFFKIRSVCSFGLLLIVYQFSSSNTYPDLLIHCGG